MNKLRFIGVLGLAVFLFTNTSFAANFPLEITNIKPAGTGNPAIPATNRIFRAYPGIEYNIRAAVIGGVYPYTHSLSNAPAGMTINSFTGEIVWTNPQTNAGPITLTVVDQENTIVTTSWSIDVTTNGFIFVDASYSGTETGSITQPYSSFLNMLSATYQGSRTEIAYIRGGNYILPQWNSSDTSAVVLAGGNAAVNLTENAAIWLGYPGETVTIDADRRFIFAVGSNLYFDNLNMSNFSDYGIWISSNRSYITIRRNNLSNISAVRSSNNNQGMIFMSRGSSFGSYLVIQDNEIHNFGTFSAIGSLYYHNKTLIENNYIHSPTTGAANKNAPKYKQHYITIRGNKVVMSMGVPLSYYMNSAFVFQYHSEICFNFFHQTGGYIVHQWNSHGNQGTTYYHRNTAVGQRHHFRFNPVGDGPFNFYNNVLVHGSNEINRAGVTASGNLENTVGVVDSNGLLLASYSSYLGNTGWQFSDGSTPLSRTTTPPVIIRADVDGQNGISSTDAMLTLRNSLSLDMSSTNWQPSPTTGDANCDNYSNTADAMLILRQSLGLSMSGTSWCL